MSALRPFVPPDWKGTLAERGGRCLVEAYARYPVELVGGRGCRVVDSSGREYLDFAAGIAVSSLGHAHPALIAALREAADGLVHVSNLYWTEPMVRLAERLVAATDMERVFFCNSGAEAIEGALKVARKARPGRKKFVVFDGSFHGRTFGALSATSQPKYQAPFAPLVEGFEAVPFGDREAVLQAVDDRTAAVLVEPIQGEGGVRPTPPGFLRFLRETCDARGALLLLDEIQCGVGRTGRLYAHQAEEVVPDVLATAKGLGGGLPIAAWLARGDAATALAPGEHGSTFGGGPLVTRVARAVLDVILQPGFLESVTARGSQLGEALGTIASRHAGVTEARGRGLMWGLQLAGDRAGALVDAVRERGLLAVPSGKSVLRLLPPLVVSEGEVAEAVTIVDDALGALDVRGA